jgi:hypothetical protein
MYADVGNPSTPEDLFTWWAGLQTPDTVGTTLADWEVVQYRDAWCFTRQDSGRDGDAYLIRGTSLAHFGWDDDTLESAYLMLMRSSRPSPFDPRVLGRRAG